MSGAPRTGHGVVRIIGGEFRSRRIRFEATDGLRPTPDRVRETLFNWLAPVIQGARCLDLFAGSGALGFEAASRGAANVTLVEHNRRAFRHLEDNRRLLDLERVRVLRESAWSFLHRADGVYDIIFLDPPFDGDALDRALGILETSTLLGAGGMVYVEHRAARRVGDESAAWTTLKRGRSGDVEYRLAQRAGEGPAP